MTQMMQIRQGLDDAHRQDAARLYWQAFGPKLAVALRPEACGRAFIETVLRPDHAICAVAADGALIGVAGFKTAEGAFVGGGMKDLARLYGWFGSLWRAALLMLLERPIEPGRLLMDGICVDASARGQGVGSALLDAVFEEAGRRGLDEVRLDVVDSNPRARALYERHGFIAVATTHNAPFTKLVGHASSTTMVRTVAAKAT